MLEVASRINVKIRKTINFLQGARLFCVYLSDQFTASNMTRRYSNNIRKYTLENTEDEKKKKKKDNPEKMAT